MKHNGIQPRTADDKEARQRKKEDDINPMDNGQHEGKVLPVCYRCTQVPRNGLYDGFRVQGMFFCSDCQQELMNAGQDTPEYQEFLFLIKGLMF